MRRIHPGWKKEFRLDSNDLGFICAGVNFVGSYEWHTLIYLSCLKKRLVSWQLSGPYGVTKYGSGWRKDVVNQCLEFGAMCVKVEVAIMATPVLNSLYGLCGRKATLNWTCCLKRENRWKYASCFGLPHYKHTHIRLNLVCVVGGGEEWGRGERGRGGVFGWYFKRYHFLSGFCIQVVFHFFGTDSSAQFDSAWYLWAQKGPWIMHS